MIDLKTLSKKVGKRIAELRQEKGLTQEQLALEAGLNRAYIGYIERGERNPSIETIAKIANSLNIEFGEFFVF